jgi:hypothetical protein
MNKDEILAKSREENKNQDIFEKEVLRDAGGIEAIAAAVLATIFFIIQIFVGEGMNYGLYAVVFSIPTTGFIVKSIRMKRKHEIWTAIIYTLLTLALSAAHIYNLITSAKIL